MGFVGAIWTMAQAGELNKDLLVHGSAIPATTFGQWANIPYSMVKPGGMKTIIAAQWTTSHTTW